MQAASGYPSGPSFHSEVEAEAYRDHVLRETAALTATHPEPGLTAQESSPEPVFASI